MSLLIGICSILRALSFYHLIHTHAYLSLDVSCTKREQTLFGKNQQYWFASDNGKEYAFSLEKEYQTPRGTSVSAVLPETTAGNRAIDAMCGIFSAKKKPPPTPGPSAPPLQIERGTARAAPPPPLGADFFFITTHLS